MRLCVYASDVDSGDIQLLVFIDGADMPSYFQA